MIRHIQSVTKPFLQFETLILMFIEGWRFVWQQQDLES